MTCQVRFPYSGVCLFAFLSISGSFVVYVLCIVPLCIFFLLLILNRAVVVVVGVVVVVERFYFYFIIRHKQNMTKGHNK